DESVFLSCRQQRIIQDLLPSIAVVSRGQGGQRSCSRPAVPNSSGGVGRAIQIVAREKRSNRRQHPLFGNLGVKREGPLQHRWYRVRRQPFYEDGQQFRVGLLVERPGSLEEFGRRGIDIRPERFDDARKGPSLRERRQARG